MKGELTVKGGKCTMEKMSPQPRTVTQLMLWAEYDENTHASLLVHTACHGIHNLIVEFVERGQPLLLKLEHLGRWEKALICADNTLKDIASQKSGSSGSNHFFIPHSNYTPTQKAQTPVASTSTGSSMAAVHPNAPGTFGGMGVPMYLAKALMQLARSEERRVGERVFNWV